nr:hypothetical protein [Tanacetum cinerariifolium]
MAVAPTTVEQRLTKKNELKARGTLLMALPDKHQLKFNTHKDAKSLMEAIEKSTNESVSAVTSVSATSTKVLVSALPNVDNLSDAEMDLKWQMDMLTMRARRFLQRTRRNLGANGTTSIGFDMLKADEEPTNYALMAFTSSSSLGSVNEVAPCTEACSKAYATLQSHYDKLTIDLMKSQFDVFSYKTGLEFVKASDELISSESDESVPTSPVHDRYKLGEGYHAVPPPYTGTFMPYKPDLVFYDASTVSATIPNVLNVEPSTTKPIKELSQSNRPSAPIIEDWVFDSEDESEGEPMPTQKEPSFVQTFEHVKTPRTSVKLVEHTIQAENLRKDTLKSRGGKITGKGKIRTGKLDFDDVYFVKELKFNLLSVSQMCDKKKSVLFTDTECVVLYSDFKLLDENHVLLRVPREKNMYNVDLKNIVPLGDLTCFFAKVTLDESNLWHKGLGHINFKTMNKLVKGIKREFSVARTPQQNGIAKIKNRTLIKAAKTMLADSLLPILFWDEAVNTACYVQNRVLVTKPHNKTPYELLLGRTPSIGFMRPFGCHVTILNTLDPLGKFNGKVDEGFLVGYSVSSKKVALHGCLILILSPSTVGKEVEFTQRYMLLPLWFTGSKDPHNTDADVVFDVKKPESEVYVSLSSSDKTKKHDEKTKREAKGKSHVELSIGSPTTRVHKDHPVTQIIGDLSSAPQTRSMARIVKEQGRLTHINNEDFHTCMFTCFLSQEEPKRVYQALKDPSWIEAMQEELLQFKMQKVWVLVDLPKGFEDPDHLDKVYKVVKALYGLHQATRAWYKTLANYLLENELCKAFEKLMKDMFQMSSIGELTFFLGLQVKQKVDGIFISQDKYVAEILRKFDLIERKSANTPIDTEKPLLKDPDGKDIDVYTYRSMIGSLMYPTSSRPDIMFAVCACARFQVTPKVSHLHAVKRIFRQIINDVSSKLMLFGLTIAAVHLMLLDRKKVIITEDTIRQALRLDDAAGVGCLPNKEIFAELARMGYEKPGLARMNLVLLWLQLSSALPQAVEDAAEDEDDNNEVSAEPTPPSSIHAATPPPSLTQEHIPSPPQAQTAQPSSPPPPQQPSQTDDISQSEMTLLNTLMKTCITLTKKEDASKQRRKIAKLDADEDVTLEDVNAEVAMDVDVQGSMQDTDEIEHAEVEEVIEVVTAAKMMTELVTTAATTITVPQVPKASAPRRRKGVVIQDPEETATALVIVYLEVKSKDKGKGILIEEPKPLKIQAQIEQDEAFARQLEAKLNANINWNDVIDQARKNMMIYLKNMAGFKMEFFRGMTYNEIRPIFKKHYNLNQAFLERVEEEATGQIEEGSKRKGDSLNQDATKKRMIDEEE